MREPTTRHRSGLSSSTDTQAGTAFGTPAFMSPEQADGRLDQLGPASDVYSLGAVLYTLLCGKTPFEYVWCDVTALIDRVQARRVPRAAESQRPGSPHARGRMLEGDGDPPGKPLCRGHGLGPGDQAVAGGRAGRMLSRASARRGWRGGAGGTSRSSPAQPPSLLTAVAALSVGIVLVGREQRKTENQRLAAVQQRELVSEKAESLRRRDAVSRVNLAYREYLDDNVALADELLDGCPGDLREWEWEYAHRLGHSELKTFAGSSQGQDVWSVAFSPDGALLACGSGPWSYVGAGPTGELLVRSVQTGAEVFALRGLTGAVQALAFSPDGRRLAAAWGFTGKDQGAELAVFDVPGGHKVWEKPERGRPDPQPGVFS